jgi:TolA-binding protein
VDASDFVAWAGGTSALAMALSVAVRQGAGAFESLARARAAKVAAEAKRIEAEALVDAAGARSFVDALDRVKHLEGRVTELERQVDEREARVRHLEGQQAVLQLQLDMARRAQDAAEARARMLSLQFDALSNDVSAGYTNPHNPPGQDGLPTPMLPPRPDSGR